MIMVVDTSVIIRFLTGDDKDKAERFRKFIQNKEQIIVTDVVFAEIFWILKSFYKLERNTVVSMLESLLNIPSVVCRRDVLLETLSVLKDCNLSFIDSYLCAFSLIESDGKILSFDKGFNKLKSIKRIEP